MDTIAHRPKKFFLGLSWELKAFSAFRRQTLLYDLAVRFACGMCIMQRCCRCHGPCSVFVTALGFLQMSFYSSQLYKICFSPNNQYVFEKKPRHVLKNPGRGFSCLKGHVPRSPSTHAVDTDNICQSPCGSWHVFISLEEYARACMHCPALYSI